MWLFVLLSVVLFFYYWYRTYARIPRSDFPPGPMPLPLVGHLPIVKGKHLMEAIGKVHDDYGEIMSVNLGPSERMVFIADYHALKEVFKDDKATSRPQQIMWFNKYFRYGNGYDSRGLLFSKGEEWTEQRRFTLRRLRDFGLGKSSMEELIMDEVGQLSQRIDKDLGQPIPVKNLFNISVVNALWTLISGKRTSLDDPELIDLVHKMDELVVSSSSVSIVNFFPALRFIAPGLTGWTKSVNAVKPIVDYVQRIQDEHIDNFSKNRETLSEDPHDFIDAFLAQISDDAEAKSFRGELGLQNLRSDLLDLMIAGTETTSTALSWATLIMMKYPDIQAKVREEIHNNVGTSRSLSINDKPNLPYTEAVCQEVLRFRIIAPIGVPHMADTDIFINGHCIPKGTTIMSNLYRIVNNPEVFPNPKEFRPERFIGSDGKFLKNDQNIAFSIGKRDCLGKSLAITQLFLFFAALVQRFKITSPNPDDLDLDPVIASTLHPKPFDAIFTKCA